LQLIAQTQESLTFKPNALKPAQLRLPVDAHFLATKSQRLAETKRRIKHLKELLLYTNNVQITLISRAFAVRTNFPVVRSAQATSSNSTLNKGLFN
jgi:hypothetical protein